MYNNLGLILPLLLMLLASIRTEDTQQPICEPFHDNCNPCTKLHKCHFIVWDSKNGKIEPVTRCVSITLSEEDVRKQGPYGNDDEHSHWQMRPLTKTTDCQWHHLKKAHGLLLNLAKQKCYAMDTEYFGNDITFIDGVQSALECQTKCFKEEKCNGFTWSEIADKSIDMPKNRCQLKDSIPNATIKSGVISGPKTCDSSVSTATTPRTVTNNELSTIESNQDMTNSRQDVIDPNSLPKVEDAFKNKTLSADSKQNFTDKKELASKESRMKGRIYEQEKTIQRLMNENSDLTNAGAINSSSFHVGSFVGGMILVLMLNVIIVFGIRFYNARGNRNYNYLLWGDSNS